MDMGNPHMDMGNPHTDMGNPHMDMGNPRTDTGNPLMVTFYIPSPSVKPRVARRCTTRECGGTSRVSQIFPPMI